MTRIIRTFSYLTLILLTLYSCQESEPKFNLQTNEELSTLESKDCNNNNEVTIEKVMALFNVIKGTRSSINIDCVLDEAKDTLLYVYNKLKVAGLSSPPTTECLLLSLKAI